MRPEKNNYLNWPICKKWNELFLLCLLAGNFFACRPTHPVLLQVTTISNNEKGSGGIQVLNMEAEKRVDVFYDGQLFTSYIYPDNIAKPVLYPLISRSGKILTRGFPLRKVAGERVDHIHHIGLWFNYGNVNGLDFWNNPGVVPGDKKHRYGTIRHKEILDYKSGPEIGQLDVAADWLNPTNRVLLQENTRFIFSQNENDRIIDRITTLKAMEDIDFEDNKEGLLGIRVARALELPADNPVLLTDEQGNPMKVKTLNNEGVNGNYLSSEGKEGNEVWGTRGKWVNLYGEIEGDPVSVTIIDHPKNVGYPTYWHARGYGLFAANPLGQKVFSNGKEILNFKLPAGSEVTFRYRIVIHSGSPFKKEALDRLAEVFAKEY